MNEYEAAAAIGDVVRRLHSYELTPEQGAQRLKRAMSDAVCAGQINARITTAIRANHDALMHAQNRNADLIKLRDLLNATP